MTSIKELFTLSKLIIKNKKFNKVQNETEYMQNEAIDTLSDIYEAEINDIKNFDEVIEENIDSIKISEKSYTEKSRVSVSKYGQTTTNTKTYTVKYDNYKPLNRDNIFKEDYDFISNYFETSLSTDKNLNCIKYDDLKEKFIKNEYDIEYTLKRYEERYKTKYNSTIYKLMILTLKAERKSILYKLNKDNLEICINDIKILSEKFLNIALEGDKVIFETVKKFIYKVEKLFINSIEIEWESYNRELSEVD